MDSEARKHEHTARDRHREDDMETVYRRDRQSEVSTHCIEHNNSRGQTLIEYVLIIVVIALVLITAMKFFEGKVSSTYNSAASSIPPPPP